MSPMGFEWVTVFFHSLDSIRSDVKTSPWSQSHKVLCKQYHWLVSRQLFWINEYYKRGNHLGALEVTKLNMLQFSFLLLWCIPDPSTTIRCGIRSSFPNETGSLKFNVPSKISMMIGWYNSPSLLPSSRYPTPSPPTGAKRKPDPVSSSLACTFSLGEHPW